jgi:hypothetical protein
MRRILILSAALLPFVALAPDDASAQRRFGGGGFRQGGFGGVRPAVVPRGGFTPGRTRGQFGPDYWRPPAGWRPGWGANRSFRPGWVRPAYWRRGWGWSAGWGPGWGWGSSWGWGAAGLATGVALGAAAATPAPVFAAPVGGIGNFCATPARTCQLVSPAQIGIGCSCRVPGGRARGTVIGS